MDLILKGYEFNNNALSNSVANFFSHSTSKTIVNNKNSKKNWATGVETWESVVVKFIWLNNHALHYAVVSLSENGKHTSISVNIFETGNMKIFTYGIFLLHKLNSCRRNYSREETICGNTVLSFMAYELKTSQH